MIYDNTNNGKVGTGLKEKINQGTKLSVLSGLFSIYGFQTLKKDLKKVAQTRLLLSGWSDDKIPVLAGGQTEIRLKNHLTQVRIAAECTAWIKKHTEVKAFLNADKTTPNLFHLADTEAPFAIHGSSDFTATGLGQTRSDNYEMNTGITDVEDIKDLLAWFDRIWNDEMEVRNIKAEVLEHLEFIASTHSASFVYFIMLYNIFENILEDIDEDSIIRSKTGFKDTLVWNKLYKFQRDGVLGAIDKLQKYNGCIIADSVGLGKTFEALAVIKYYELRNHRVLVLCPKKLRENWAVFTYNDKRNLFIGDRFNFDVLNHTDLSRPSGISGEINLDTVNWGNYDLIVIDESHNFKNSGTKAGGATRYQKLMKEIVKSGVKTKVLMLSATPVNSRMTDLKNQIAFITEGQDDALKDFGINSIDNTLRRAQTNFNRWLKLSEPERTTEKLLDGMNFDYFKMLDLLTIARSRKHIEKYYDIEEMGKFPERLKPINIKADIDTSGQFPPLKQINTAIAKLNLAAYAPLEYVHKNKKEEYNRKYDQEVGGGIFRQSDRERNIVGLMRVNILKRMESSISSFTLTVEKIHNKIKSIIEQIDTFEVSEFESLSIEEIVIDDPDLEEYLIGKKVKVLLQDMDLLRWRQDLEEDLEALAHLLQNAQKVKPVSDAKLAELKVLVKDKAKNPINDDNKKLIVFTAFSDTAEYLYAHIADWAQKELNLNAALITGGVQKCTIKDLGKDPNNILTHFSPISKERDKIAPEATTQIDILIATDCISEGQNLQDCDMLINYDIHWNPVRIIQRFGRVDRLGSQNNKIQLINFWPNIELDEYINLESRVRGRMAMMDISSTGEENLIEFNKKKEMNDLQYRRKQIKQLRNTVLDLEDMDGNVSITDMTLNDFRMDLSGYMKDNLPLLQKSPSGFFATVAPTQRIPAGAIFCLKDIYAKLIPDPSYALAPFYLVYVQEDGALVFDHLQGKKTLDIFKKLHGVNKIVDNTAHANLMKSTKNGKNMGNYQFMLERAIASIIGKAEERGIESLFLRGGTTLTQAQFQGSEDFEVISYVIIKGDND